MKLKVCGNKYNIYEVAALQPYAMGFIFYSKSPRNVSVKEIEREVAGLKNILRVGVFVNEKKETILDTVQVLGLDLVQLHGDESPVFCENLYSQVKLMKALDGNNPHLQEEIDKYSGVVDLFLFDSRTSAYGGTGTKFDHAVLEKLQVNVPFWVAGGIGPNDIDATNQLKKLPGCLGIDVNSGFETAPGRKSIGPLKTFKQTTGL